MADDLLLVGRVARPHGIRGQVIVNPETDFAGERFTPGQTLLVGPPGQTVPRRIVEARFHKGRPIVAFEDVATMNDAEALAGAELWMPQAEMAPLPAGTSYRHDLVGCEVRDRAGTVIGEVREVEGTLERSYLIVKGAHGDVMIPMIDEICVTVSPTERLIVVAPPDGLLEVNRRGGGASAQE
jgi:16S rRNA processing protein RimM